MKEIGNGSRTDFIRKNIAKLNFLAVPDNLKSSIVPEFDPCLCIVDVIESSMP